MGILAGKNERGCMEMESDSLYQLEKEITVRIIQEDMESIYSLMCTEKDPIFSMAILPYYALFVQACQAYMGEEYLPNVEAKRVKNKNILNAYGLYYAYPVVNENHQRLRVSLRLLRLIICK